MYKLYIKIRELSKKNQLTNQLTRYNIKNLSY